MKKSKKIIWLSVLAIFAIIMMTISINFHLLIYHIEANIPFHSTIEAFGSLSAIFFGVLLYYYKNDDEQINFYWFSIALFVMGIFDFFHAISNVGNNFVLFHSFSVFFGGLFCFFIVFQRMKFKIIIKNILSSLICAAVLVFSIFCFKNPDFGLSMITDGVFTDSAKFLNLVGGAFFLISTVFFGVIYYKNKSFGYYYYYVVFSLLMCLGGLTFLYDELWSDGWWLWHELRISAFVIGIIVVFLNYRKLTRNLSEKNQEYKEKNIEYLTLNEEYLAQNEEYLAQNEEYQTQNDELVIAKAKAEESEQLKSAFLANMSHEIRTPLNAVMGFSSLLKKANLSQEKKNRYIELINNGGSQLLSIISDIVDISKMDSGQIYINKDICNINNLLDDLSTQFCIVNKENKNSLKLKKILNDIDCYVSIDRARVFQIISNLLENAQKFTKKGEIEFGCEMIEKDQEMFLQFYVKDSGIGIDQANHELVFERFRQVKNDYLAEGSGTGLGLPIAKGLVELMGGKIWIESNDKGATFYFTCPYEKAQQPIKKQAEKESVCLDENTERTILIAEDELSNFLYIKELLDDFNCNIIHVDNGKDAIDVVNKTKKIDLVLMDIKMPLINGFDATLFIRETNPNLPIIMQTAYAMAEDKEQAKKVGCNEYLAKPITPKKLKELVNKYIII